MAEDDSERDRVAKRVEIHLTGRGYLPRGIRNDTAPPTTIRDALRHVYYDRMPFLAEVIDGKVLEYKEIDVRELLPFVMCANCGDVSEFTTLALSDTAQGRAGLGQKLMIPTICSAAVKDRLAALDHMAKFGLGALKEVSTETVRERLGATLGIIREKCDSDTALAIVNALREVWM